MDKDTAEKGTVRLDAVDDVTCECGNFVTDSGFSTCTPQGWPVEPTPEAWDGKSSVCLACGAIFEQDFDDDAEYPMSLPIVGVALPEYMNDPNWASWTWGEPKPAPVVA